MHVVWSYTNVVNIKEEHVLYVMHTTDVEIVDSSWHYFNQKSNLVLMHMHDTSSNIT